MMHSLMLYLLLLVSLVSPVFGYILNFDVEPLAKGVGHSVQVGVPFTFVISIHNNDYTLATGYSGQIHASAIRPSSYSWSGPASAPVINGVARIPLTFNTENLQPGVIVTFTDDSGDRIYSCNFDIVASGAFGDPQFTGLQGQDYQVHGSPDSLFNLISWPSMGYALNSQFVYLSHGSCDYNNTACWSHPGTYLGQLGFLIDNSTRILILSGSHKDGLSVSIDDVPMRVADGTFYTAIPDSAISDSTFVSFENRDTVIVASSTFTIKVVNSDLFMNLNVDMHDANLLAAGAERHVFKSRAPTIEPQSANSGKLISLAKHDCPNKYYTNSDLHGLLGQTWRNAEFVTTNGEVRVYEGDVDDYQVNEMFGYLPMDLFQHTN